MTRYRRLASLLCALALLWAAAPPAMALTRDDLRALAADAAQPWPEEPFAEPPSIAAPYAAGALDEALIDAALGRLNFVRTLAGLRPARADDALCRLAQHGAVLMAAQKTVSHAPDPPGDMDADFFAQAAGAAANCSLASFNWFSPALAAESMDWFVRDDTAPNLGELAHRRWMLCPHMGRTGFGLALDGEGRSYAALYVTDLSAPDDYDFVLWPAPGAFPADLMRAETPWSVSPNPVKCDLTRSAPHVLLEELTTGARWDFAGADADPAQGAYCLIDDRSFGDGPALIFRPDLADWPALEDGYEQNQVWRATVSGLTAADGAPLEPVVYTVEMASLTPIDPASVELSARSLALRPGETAAVGATVYPRWADDLSCALSTSDSSVAVVDENGLVTALAAGQCLLRAEAVNGRFDEIEITVNE